MERKHLAPSVLVLMCSLFVHTAMAVDKDRYRPYKHDYPQIIQATDMPTIEAIENIVAEIHKLPKGPVTCSYDNGVVTLQSGGEIFDISTFDNYEVVMEEKHYRDRNAVVYFNTLIRMVRDLSKTGECRVRFGEFATRAYKTRTVVDFAFGPQVIELDAYSNGPNDDERLYTLDLVNRKGSFYFGG